MRSHYAHIVWSKGSLVVYTVAVLVLGVLLGYFYQWVLP